MKIKFLGGIGRVTGSCSWLRYDKTDTEFLVDCGMVQGETHANYENGKKFPFDPNKIKFVLLTHAHLDHCGLIPRLYKEGFCGKVFCTKATAELSKLILFNSAQLDGPYSKTDVTKINFEPVDTYSHFKWGYNFPIDDDILVYFLRSSHILGSTSIGIVWFGDAESENKSILFSGDIGNNVSESQFQPLLKDGQLPHIPTNYIVLESTYGSNIRDHSFKSFENRIAKLNKIIIDTIYKKRGQLIIPTFSLHRTQEILFDIYFLLNVKWQGISPVPSNPNLSELKNGISASLFNSWIDKCEDFDEDDRRFIDKCMDTDIISELKFDQYKNLKNKVIDHPDRRKLLEKCYIKNKYKEKYLKNESINPDDLAKIIFELVRNKKFAFLVYRIKNIDNEKLSKLQILLNKINLKQPVKIILDSPLANNITKLYGKLLNQKIISNEKRAYRNKKIIEWLKVSSENDVDAIIGKLYSENELKCGDHFIKFKTAKDNSDHGSRPAIYITSSGMCDAGPVLEHLKRVLPDNNNTILLTGYQSKNTNGYILKNLSDAKTSTQKIMMNDDKYIRCCDIKAEILDISGYYSGHADQESLLKYVFLNYNKEIFTIPKVFLNHGNDQCRQSLKEKILEASTELLKKTASEKEYKTEVILPQKDYNNWYDLENDQWCEKKFEMTEKITNDMFLKLIKLDSNVKNMTKQISCLSNKIEKLLPPN